MRPASRRLAWAGVIGPASFVSAWVGGAALTPGYSSVETAISRLAAIGAPTRPVMTAGFVAFGVALPIYARALHEHITGPAWVTAAGTGLATLGVALFPLGHSGTVDIVHGSFATIGYATLAATPALAAPALRRAGRGRWAVLSLATGALASASLAATVLGRHHGFFQRAGLTVGDAWIVTSALVMAASPARRLGEVKA